MAILQVRDVDDHLYETLKERARRQHRSLSQEVVEILEDYFSRPPTDSKSQTDLFLQLAGAWQGPETAQQLITKIRQSRVRSRRFRRLHGLSD